MKQLQDATHTLVYGINDIHYAADYLYSLRDQCSIYTFTGSLGAGKTTLVQELLRRYGVTDTILSPTFTYVHIYRDAQGRQLYHFDLYRLASTDAFIAAGFDEYISQPASWSFIEWPEVVEPLLHDRVCRVFLDYGNLEERRMTCFIRKK